ncbi:hypothetical protein Nm8I071_44180 [Nonomuraea sp. TT08I-71]|nr:hypothetical protein Nm8I071_44180 [Nonomuraea sp. TT08I-71]
MTDPADRVRLPVGFDAARGPAVAWDAPGGVPCGRPARRGTIDEKHQPLNGAGDTGDPRGTG